MTNPFIAFAKLAALFEWIAIYPETAKYCETCGKLAHVRDPLWEGNLCRECHKEANPYSVLLFATHPDQGNDDCCTGWDYPTLEAAKAFAANLGTFRTDMVWLSIALVTHEWIMIAGPESEEVIRNPCFDRKLRAKHAKADRDADRSEYAMQQGMAFGCQGYNEAMGYDVETERY